MKRADARLSSRWIVFLLVSLLAGLALRLIWAEDMEFKEDEHYNFILTQFIGRSQPWPWLGMNSGVYVPNPGMSIWVFVWLARLTGATYATELAQALQLFSVLGIALVIPFALKFVSRDRDREAWLWAFALAMVNPIHIWVERKLWPQGFLPFFCMLMLMGWWKRDRWLGSFAWGLFGACLGQIHMSGFFYAFAFFVWTLLFSRKLDEPKRVNWIGWLAGSCLGAIPVAFWAYWVISHPIAQSTGSSLENMLQLKFWVFWISNPLGLHLGNPIGILRGSGVAQLSDFVRYPLVAGQATYLCALAHLVLLGGGIAIYGSALLRWIRSFRENQPRQGYAKFLIGDGSQTSFSIRSTVLGFGAFITLSGVNIRRYYTMINFPLDFVWLGRLALSNTRFGRVLLAAIWIACLFVSACFVGYIHVNQGSSQGDYGEAFHVIRERNLREKGVPYDGYPPTPNPFRRPDF